MTAAALLAAGAAFAEPPAALAPALKLEIGAVSRAVFRNGAYTLIELRSRIAEAQEREAMRKLAATGLRERVLEETTDFLGQLGPELTRIAGESATREEFQARVDGIAAQVDGWSKGTLAAPAARTPTEDNIEGPFYRPNAPMGDTLSPEGAEGQEAVISGTVLDVEGKPVASALVDVWQADAKGDYDIADPAERNNPRVAYKFRARMHANADGRYTFKTVMPGQYEIGEGKWRPKHIHFKVSAPGLKPLTTQLYFEGDQYNAVDPWWKPGLTIRMRQTHSPIIRGTFDITLAKGR
jgi:protocatechuate 3,4-dioxygenase beta subunit